MTPIEKGRAVTRRRHRRRARVSTWTSALAATAVILTGGITAAHADTVYEIEGRWAASTPDVVAKGDSVVSEWRFNINDDQPAPDNTTIPNTTVTFTVANGVFTVLPVACLTAGVTPVSEISADGTTMICNLGDRDEGTADLVLTGIQVTGKTGDKVSITGAIGDQTATTPELDIENPFAMDMKWDQGTPSNTTSGDYQVLGFPWSLRHTPGAENGPGTVQYTVTIDRPSNETVVARPTANGGACTPISTSQPGHPYSGANGTAGVNRAPFPTCTMVQVGTTNNYTVTISNIDYSKSTLPKKDTNGTDLATEWDTIAAGMIWFRLTYVGAGRLSILANTPTYTSIPGGTTVQDDPSNNANEVAFTRGTWTGGWGLRYLANPVQGALWTDTYRQMAGQKVMAISGARPPQGTETNTAVCQVIDTAHITFEWAKVGTISAGVVTPYGGTQPEIRYYTGAMADPNAWQCDTVTTGWVTTPPANLSTVKAVQATFPTGLQVTGNIAHLYVQGTIKPNTPVGTDIWTWTSYRFGTGDWFHPHRNFDTATRPASGVLTPGTSYPYTGGGRDILRVVGAKPVIDKSVAQPETIPGATVGYTIKFRAESSADAVLPEYTLVDLLPAGTTYVPGSASVEPTEITTVSGRPQLTWVFTDYVSTNADYFMTYDLVIPDTAEPGDVFVNNATSSIGNQTAADSARLRIREGGFVFITKNAHLDAVPHVNGAATDGWTVRLTSQDTARQMWTDTIDVLPYNGDNRGTDFAGTYTLTGPIDVSDMPGATVYYTEADPTTISDDPKDPSNGAAPTDITGNTVGWTETFTEDATAVRVVGGELRPNATQAFTVNVVTSGAEYEDVYVNRAQAVASRTNLVIRTSDRFEIAAQKSLTIKKYVQDDAGNWHDAQNIDDYPGFAQGASLNYRLVVTNTGDIPLQDVAITDDKVDLSGLSPLPAGLGAGAVIAELLPGAENAVTIEYTVPLAGPAVGQTLINNACAVAADPEVQESCDPAGVTVLPSSLAWSKIAADTEGVRLAGAEWELTPIDAAGAPTGTPIAVIDCIGPAATDCTDADKDHRGGEFLVLGLEAGRYMLVETAAPAGYVLDSTPRYVDVAGDTVLGTPIENTQRSGLVIPLTGGQSTELFLVIGAGLAGLMALLMMLLYRRRRAAASEANTPVL